MFNVGNKGERQRDRETERQRDRETERQRDRETERQRHRDTARQRDRETDIYLEIRETLRNKRDRDGKREIKRKINTFFWGTSLYMQSIIGRVEGNKKDIRHPHNEP